MAEAISLAASVAGIASLGLQVSSGIAKYLDAINSRDDELCTAKEQNELLLRTILSVEKKINKIQQIDPAAVATVFESIKLLTAKLSGLERFIAQLACHDLSTWKSRIKDKAAKLHFAFDRSKVQHLCAKIAETISILQLTLNVLGFSTITDIHGAVLDIQSRIPQLQTILELVTSQLGTLAISVETHARNGAQELPQCLRAINDRLCSFSSIQHGHIALIENSIQAHLIENSLHNSVSGERVSHLPSIRAFSD